MGEGTRPENSVPQPTEQLKKIAEGNQQEPFLNKGIGIEINRLSTQEGPHGLPNDIEFYRRTSPAFLKPRLIVMNAIHLLEQFTGIDKKTTSTLTEVMAVRQTELSCLLLAERLGLSPQEIAQNLKPQEGETPGQTLMRLTEWQMEMMEKLSQQK
jgi:AraC-like DNA-binding protein